MLRANCYFLVLLIFFSTSLLNAQPPEAGGGDPEKMKLRVMEFKKKKLSEVLDLSTDVQEKFLTQYLAGQEKIDDAKKILDEKVRTLHQAVKKSNAAEITNGTDELMKAYEALNAAVKNRVVSLKPILTREQYAKLMMFEIRFPEVLQRMIFKRGLGKHGLQRDG